MKKLLLSLLALAAAAAPLRAQKAVRVDNATSVLSEPADLWTANAAAIAAAAAGSFADRQIAPAAIGATSSVALTHVALWGDSLTAAGNGYGPDFALLSGLVTYNGGVGGETSTQIKTRMLAAADKYAWPVIIWAGRNNLADGATVQADIAAMVAALGHTRYYVLSVIAASTDSDTAKGQIAALNAALSSTYGAHYLDVRSYLLGDALADEGITPTGQDTADIAAGITPTSLRSDTLHPNAAGQDAIARFVYAHWDGGLGKVIGAALASFGEIGGASPGNVTASALTLKNSYGTLTWSPSPDAANFLSGGGILPTPDVTRTLGDLAHRWNGIFGKTATLKPASGEQPLVLYPSAASSVGGGIDFVNTDGSGLARLGVRAVDGSIDSKLHVIFHPGGTWTEVGNFSASGWSGPVVNTPAGGISSTTVQAALNELDTEKVPAARTLTATAPLTIDGLSGASDLSTNRTLAVSTATTAAPGVVRLATTTEATTGTDTATALSPATGAAAITAAVQPLAATRAPVDYAYCDGLTPNRAIVQTFGPAADIAGSPITEGPHFFRVPSSATANRKEILGIGSTSAGLQSILANTLTIFNENNGDDLTLRETGATSGDYRQLRYSTFRSDYAGQMVGLIVSITPGTASPVIWLWTQAQGWRDATASFAATTAGTPPDWMAAALVPTYRLIGYNWTVGEIRPGRLINRAWTQTDMTYYAATGRIPPRDELPGSMVPFYVNDGTAANGLGPAGSSPTAAFDADTTVTGKLYMQLAATGNSWLASGQTYPFAGLYGWSLKARLNSGTGLTLKIGAALTDPEVGTFAPTGTEATYRGSFFSSAGGSFLRIGAVGNANGSAYELDDIEVWPIGTIAAADLGWTAQARGKYNGIDGTLTAGVTPMPAHDEPVQVISGSLSATGYVLGFSGPHVFRDYTITHVAVRPTTATIPDVTLRRNATTGGTPIVSAASAGTQGAWTSLPITGGTEDGGAGDYFHITLSTAAALDYRLTLSRR